MKKKNLFKCLIILASVILLIFLCFLIDFNRVTENREPLFSIQKASYNDNKNIEYIGIGYKIYKEYDEENNKILVKFGTLFSSFETIMGDEFNDKKNRTVSSSR